MNNQNTLSAANKKTENDKKIDLSVFNSMLGGDIMLLDDEMVANIDHMIKEKFDRCAVRVYLL